MGISTERGRLLGQAGLLVCVALACAPKLGNAFVWDDIPLIVESDRLFDLRNLPRIFAHDTMYAADGGKFQAQAQLDTYRPITMASFFVDAALSGRNPLGYHLDNLLVHLICVALAYRWALRMLGPAYPYAALFSAAFFGLHPVLAEAHVWINGRSDLYCTLFGLAGALVYTASPGAVKLPHALASFTLFLLGLLSKETLAPFLMVLMLWDIGVFQRELGGWRFGRAQLLRALPVMLALTTYAALRMQALSGLHTSAGGAQLWLALQRLPVLLLDGLSTTLAPSRVMPRYLSEEYAQITALGLAAHALVVGLMLVLVFRVRARYPSLAFGLSGFAAVLAPASLIATMAWYGLGRYLYLPIALLAPGLAELGSHGVHWLAGRGAFAARAVRWGAVAYLFLFAGRLAAAAPNWNGPLVFYQSILAESPAVSHGHGGLGKYLIDEGDLEGAVRELQSAVALAPADSRYLNNLGVAFLRAGDAAQARQVAEVGLSRFPEHQAKFEKLRVLATRR